MEEIFIDTRDMEPPEPFEKVTAALKVLESSQYVHMLSRRRPLLLYPWLADNAFDESTIEQDQDVFHIYIWPSADTIIAQEVALLLSRH